MSKRNLHLAAPGGKAASAESIYKPRPLNNAEFDIRNNNIQNIWKAILLARKGRLGECGALCDKILSEETSSESFLLLKAKILFDAGNFAQALMIYEQVLKRMPYLQEASIMECACNARLGNHEIVLASFLKINKEESKREAKLDQKWFEMAGESYLHLEQYLKAQECFETSLSIKSTANAFICLFKIHDLIGQPLDKLAKDSRVAFPSNVTILQLLGNWHLEKERYDLALELFTRVIHIDPSNREAVLLYGSLLDKSRKFGQALGIYSTLKLNTMDFAQANNSASSFYGKSKQQDLDLLERAVAFLTLALRESPLDWKLHNNMGLCLLALNQPASAAKYLASSYSFQELQAASPSSTTLLFLAVSLGRCGDSDGARFAFEKAIEMDSSPIFIYNYIVFLIGEGSEGDKETAKESFAALREFGKEGLEVQLGENAEELINEIFIRL